ncbi:MAG: hypothetical protein CMJ81_21645 [Planctomycetaceae bacterium]|nr:hypothetical protein [Planctomycetaceae bacterium]MBP60838.1 hypothetical protein [Planctomycetaceae bacterium]
MLILTRKPQQQVEIGDKITVTLLKIQGQTVRLGIEAPREIQVLRGDLAETKSERQDDLFNLRSESELQAAPLNAGDITTRSPDAPASFPAKPVDPDKPPADQVSSLRLLLARRQKRQAARMSR